MRTWDVPNPGVARRPRLRCAAAGHGARRSQTLELGSVSVVGVTPARPICFDPYVQLRCPSTMVFRPWSTSKSSMLARLDSGDRRNEIVDVLGLPCRIPVVAQPGVHSCILTLVVGRAWRSHIGPGRPGRAVLSRTSRAASSSESIHLLPLRCRQFSRSRGVLLFLFDSSIQKHRRSNVSLTRSEHRRRDREMRRHPLPVVSRSPPRCPRRRPASSQAPRAVQARCKEVVPRG